MVRYYEKNLNLTTLIRQNWLLIGIILLIFGLVKVNADSKCCYSTSSELKTPPNSYLLNLTASHVDSKKGNNKYAAAISFKEGFTVVGEPFSPVNEVDCSQTPGTGSITQYQCDSRDNPMFFVIFQLSVKFLDSTASNSSNSSITAVSEVFIFGDKCQYTAFCTDLAAKGGDESDDKISLGPLGTWPRYAVIIGGIILSISLLVACYLVYRRNRPDDRFRDRSTTPGTHNNYEEKIFSPNSLLRDGDSPLSTDEPPKNTLIQFGSVSAQSPERSKSIRNQHKQPSSLTKSSSTKKKNENKGKKHQEIKINDNDDDYGGKVPDNDASVVIKISDDGEMEKSSRKPRKNHDKDNKNLKNLSDNSTPDLSKTISNKLSDRDLGGGNDLNNNNNEFKHSTSVRRKKSKSGPKSGSKSESKQRSKSVNHGDNESRRDKKPSSNNNNNKLRKSSTLREAGEDREGRRIDHTSSKGHRSRNDSTSPSSAPKSASDLQKGPSIRTRQSDRDLTTRNRGSNSQHQKNNRSSRNLDRKKSRDIVSDGDLESTSDRLPLAMLARSPTKSGQSKSWKSDGENDDDTTPLGRISTYSIDKTNSFGAVSTSSNSQLITADKSSEDNNNYSVLDDILSVTEDDNYPIGKRLSNISRED